MKKGRASKTAELVCMGRAIGHGQAGFEDPTALELLPEPARERVRAVRSNAPAQGLRDGVFRGYLVRQASVMIVRTMAIDDVIRKANTSQLVILGAGLDGRGWRMRELSDAIVFEVDHPDTQRDKRERAVRLTPQAKEIRFVPVDFQRDALEDALERAGHDPSRPTTWVWEGVVMYLTPAEVDATLHSIARRSANGSVVALHYHAPALFLRAVGLVVGALGEPFRSRFEPEAMRELLQRHGFAVMADASIADLAQSMPHDVRKSARAAKHLRMATAMKV